MFSRSLFCKFSLHVLEGYIESLDTRYCLIFLEVLCLFVWVLQDFFRNFKKVLCKFHRKFCKVFGKFLEVFLGYSMRVWLKVILKMFRNTNFPSRQQIRLLTKDTPALCADQPKLTPDCKMSCSILCYTILYYTIPY